MDLLLECNPHHRFAKEDCPVCSQLKNALEKEYNDLEDLYHVCIDNKTALNAETDRSIQFENLVIFGWLFILIAHVIAVTSAMFPFQQPQMPSPLLQCL